MKFVINGNQFEKAIASVRRVVERRNTIPILGNILLDAQTATIKLQATDLDLEIINTVGADVEAGGSTTVPAHTLHDIVRKLPSDAEIAVEMDDVSLALRSGRSRFKINTLPATNFPELRPANEWKTHFTAAAGTLRKLIENVQFAISTEETRYYLNGIYFHSVKDGNRKLMRAVATDGHRLAQSQIDAPTGAEDFKGIIVPRKTVAEFGRALEPADVEATIDIDDIKIRLSIGNLIITSKLIDGSFPDYTRVVPQANDKILKVDRADFRAAVDRVQTISSERGRAVKLGLEPEKLTLNCFNPDTGNAVEEIGASYDSDALEIGFNSRYLLDIGNQLTKETAELQFLDPGSPVLVRDVDESDTLFVLMPMRV